MKPLIIGTRQSQLAVWQAEYIANQLRRHFPLVEVALRYFVTQGDRIQDKPLPEIGGKGIFTAEIEEALRSSEIDLAVHSLKDLPTKLASDITLGAIPERGSIFDAFISQQGFTLASIPSGATIGTSSLRRSAQLKAVRPDLNILPLRGNVPTRIRKAFDAEHGYDAIVLAEAGLSRLQMHEVISEILPPDVMLPAPAQGALAVQCRSDDNELLAKLSVLDHAETHHAVSAERDFLRALESGCRLPVAAWARYEGEFLRLTGRVISLDGSQMITVERVVARGDEGQLGVALAEDALSQGAGIILDSIRLEHPKE